MTEMLTPATRWPVALQVVGLAAALAGLYLLAGLAWTLVAAGLVVTAWGALAESATDAAAGSSRPRLSIVRREG